ncbi:MAG: hypothetical protein ABJC63_07620 [Gemmatimonadales bacterium]
MKGISSFAVIAIVAAGCVSASQPLPSTTGTAGTVQVSMGQDFQLAAGQTGRVNGTPIAVMFRSVGADSRCPSNVQCVWAGDAVVNLSLSSTTTVSQAAALHTTLDSKFADYAGYRVKFVGLGPVPRSGSTIPASSYVVTLQVSSP